MKRVALIALALGIGGWNVAAGITVSSAGPAAQTAPGASPGETRIAELWSAPEPGRDLYYGPGGSRLAPPASTRYKVIEIKTEGYSSGYTVAGPANREWKVKFAPEAHTEVVASRIFWAVGYHQPPVYFLDRWQSSGAKDPNPQRPARFREEKPDFFNLTEEDIWSYENNPFVGSTELKGMLVLHVLLGNSDLKPEQNMVYTLGDGKGGKRRWYVARDLGQTFGKTGALNPPRNDPDAFEATKFITGVDQGTVQFEYRGLHRQLLNQITVRDVRWICERLERISDAQWRDAFRAGGIAPAVATRYLREIRERIAEGLALGTQS